MYSRNKASKRLHRYISRTKLPQRYKDIEKRADALRTELQDIKLKYFFKVPLDRNCRDILFAYLYPWSDETRRFKQRQLIESKIVKNNHYKKVIINIMVKDYRDANIRRCNNQLHNKKTLLFLNNKSGNIPVQVEHKLSEPNTITQGTVRVKFVEDNMTVSVKLKLKGHSFKACMYKSMDDGGSSWYTNTVSYRATYDFNKKEQILAEQCYEFMKNNLMYFQTRLPSDLCDLVTAFAFGTYCYSII
jgi:hypothetical protein